MIQGSNLLVFSAHAADFVWRGGGTIAKYIKGGAKVKLIIMSYGIRGESKDLWKLLDQTYEQVKELRHNEVNKAAKIIGVEDIEFWDFKDYHMTIDDERMEKIVKTIRNFRPDNILTHANGDAFNPDHELVSKSVFQA